MNTITIPRNLIHEIRISSSARKYEKLFPYFSRSTSLIKNDDLVVLSRREYESMKSRMLPVFFLKGKNAKDLDKRVAEGLKEYHQGKTETMESFLKKEFPGLRKK